MRGESKYSDLLKTHKLLIFRHAKNAEHYKIELNWNVSGTRISAVRSSGKKRDGMLVEVSVTSCIRELNGSKDIVSNRVKEHACI